jgi:hypothetical protein
MGNQGVDFDERPGVEQEIDALAGGELAGLVLLLDALDAAPQLGGAQARFEVLDSRPLGADCHGLASILSAAPLI